MIRPREAPVRPPRPWVAALMEALTLPGVGPQTLQRALDQEGSVPAAARAIINRVWSGLAEGERVRATGWAASAMRTIRDENVHVLLRGSTHYPAALERVVEPPPVLFARGRLELLRTPMIAVVGTRRCTRYGEHMARRIAGGIAASGATVLSGLARGIDGHAHAAAGARSTVGILGCGIDVVYPVVNRRLQAAIGRQGLLLSEQIPGTPPNKGAFPRRNRMLAGLSVGVVVVEAPVKSGALITARDALELGRTVFVVPGEVGKEAAAGVNALIQDGGTLVTSATEVLQALELPLPPPGAEDDIPPPDLYGVALALWRTLGHEPRHVDEVAGAVGLEPHQGLASLLSLEVMGHARQVPGMRFVRA